jgi:hypothetical protein
LPRQQQLPGHLLPLTITPWGSSVHVRPTTLACVTYIKHGMNPLCSNVTM